MATTQRTEMLLWRFQKQKRCCVVVDAFPLIEISPGMPTASSTCNDELPGALVLNLLNEPASRKSNIWASWGSSAVHHSFLHFFLNLVPRSKKLEVGKTTLTRLATQSIFLKFLLILAG